jgi:transcriptional regulator GlxA family with amidase domain
VSLCPPRWHARRKVRSKTDSPVTASTSIGRLAATTVGGGSRLGRKNRAKARKTNGTSDDDENDGVRVGVGHLDRVSFLLNQTGHLDPTRTTTHLVSLALITSHLGNKNEEE